MLTAPYDRWSLKLITWILIGTEPWRLVQSSVSLNISFKYHNVWLKNSSNLRYGVVLKASQSLWYSIFSMAES